MAGEAGKGDKRRRRSPHVTYEEYARRWEQALGRQKKKAEVKKCRDAH